ncbi:MAG: hypothetical protein AVDCRST_MAG19-3620, partial [uncultured Thermomicrobiales bacterium]
GQRAGRGGGTDGRAAPAPSRGGLGRPRPDRRLHRWTLPRRGRRSRRPRGHPAPLRGQRPLGGGPHRSVPGFCLDARRPGLPVPVPGRGAGRRGGSARVRDGAGRHRHLRGQPGGGRGGDQVRRGRVAARSRRGEGGGAAGRRRRAARRDRPERLRRADLGDGSAPRGPGDRGRPRLSAVAGVGGGGDRGRLGHARPPGRPRWIHPGRVDDAGRRPAGALDAGPGGLPLAPEHRGDCTRPGCPDPV